MTLPEGITFGSFVLASVGFMYKITFDEEAKRARIYSRIDEVKKSFEEKTQSKEICNIHIESINNTLNEIKMDVKQLLKKSEVT